MPIEHDKQNFLLQMGYDRIPVSQIQEFSCDDFVPDNSFVKTLKENKSVTIDVAMDRKSTNKLIAALMNVNIRVLHLIKYGKTKRVRNKNKKRYFGYKV
jgi:hypothetical protein